MPYRKNDFVPGCYYHAYNRGIDSKNIFYSKENYNHFLRLCKKYNSKYQVEITAYCLMPNHFHLLLKQLNDIPISRFIQITLNAYVQALNKQINRTGPLFVGRFRHVLVDKEEYLLHVVRYIHLNPTKAKLTEKPEEWPYSDYQDWIYSDIKKSFINQHFQKLEGYEKFVKEYQREVLYVDLEKYYIDV